MEPSRWTCSSALGSAVNTASEMDLFILRGLPAIPTQRCVCSNTKVDHKTHNQRNKETDPIHTWQLLRFKTVRTRRRQAAPRADAPLSVMIRGWDGERNASGKFRLRGQDAQL